LEAFGAGGATYAQDVAGKYSASQSLETIGAWKNRDCIGAVNGMTGIMYENG
jgi:hypothetical protein